MADTERRTTPPRRPSAFLRLRRHAFRSLPAFVWLGGLMTFVWLYGRHHPSGPIDGFATETVYSIAAPTTGRLQSLTVNLQENVQSGQLLAGLDTEELQLRLKAATTELERLRAELEREEVLRSTTARELQREIATDSIQELRRFARDREETHIDYLRAIARQEEDQIHLHGISLELARQQDLQSKGLSSDSELNQVKTTHDSLAKRISEYALVVASLKQRHAESRQRYDDFAGQADPLVTAIDPLVEPFRWAIEAQQVAIEQLALARTQLALRAPVAGQIDEILIRPGEYVAAGQPILTIIDTDPSEVIAYVNEAWQANIKPGVRAILQRKSDRTRVATHVLRTGSRITRIPDRSTGDTNIVRFALPIFLARPDGMELIPGEAFTVKILED